MSDQKSYALIDYRQFSFIVSSAAGKKAQWCSWVSNFTRLVDYIASRKIKKKKQVENIHLRKCFLSVDSISKSEIMKATWQLIYEVHTGFFPGWSGNIAESRKSSFVIIFTAEAAVWKTKAFHFSLICICNKVESAPCSKCKSEKFRMHLHNLGFS